MNSATMMLIMSGYRVRHGAAIVMVLLLIGFAWYVGYLAGRIFLSHPQSSAPRARTLPVEASSEQGESANSSHRDHAAAIRTV